VAGNLRKRKNASDSGGEAGVQGGAGGAADAAVAQTHFGRKVVNKRT